MTKSMRPIWFKVEGVITASSEEDAKEKVAKVFSRVSYLNLDSIVVETSGECPLHPGFPQWPDVGCLGCAKDSLEGKRRIQALIESGRRPKITMPGQEAV